MNTTAAAVRKKRTSPSYTSFEASVENKMTAEESQHLEEIPESNILERFRIESRLGKGVSYVISGAKILPTPFQAYGIVWRAKDRKLKRVVALKKVFDAFRNSQDAQRTYREVWFLRKFSGHKNIVEILDVIIAKNPRDIYIVFEKMCECGA